MPGMSHVWSLNAEAFRAAGRPDIWPKLGALTVLILLPLLIGLAPFGLYALTAGRLIGAAVLPISIAITTSAYFNLTLGEQWGVLRGPLMASAVMYLLAYVLLSAEGPSAGIGGWLRLLITVALSGGTYLLCLRVLSPDSWSGVNSAARRLMSRT
jgi:hypothetical protein